MTKTCHSKVRKRGEKGAGRADDERADGKQAALADRLAPLAADLDQPDQVPERTCGESPYSWRRCSTHRVLPIELRPHRLSRHRCLPARPGGLP